MDFHTLSLCLSVQELAALSFSACVLSGDWKQAVLFLRSLVSSDVRLRAILSCTNPDHPLPPLSPTTSSLFPSLLTVINSSLSLSLPSSSPPPLLYFLLPILLPPILLPPILLHPHLFHPPSTLVAPLRFP